MALGNLVPFHEFISHVDLPGVASCTMIQRRWVGMGVGAGGWGCHHWVLRYPLECQKMGQKLGFSDLLCSRVTLGQVYRMLRRFFVGGMDFCLWIWNHTSLTQALSLMFCAFPLTLTYKKEFISSKGNHMYSRKDSTAEQLNPCK